MMEALGRFGLSVIETKGRQFDPALHSAMLTQPSAEHPPLTILQEVRRGYRLKGRTIRPSLVIVAEQQEPPSVPGEAQEKPQEPQGG